MKCQCRSTPAPATLQQVNFQRQVLAAPYSRGGAFYGQTACQVKMTPKIRHEARYFLAGHQLRKVGGLLAQRWLADIQLMRGKRQMPTDFQCF